MKYFSSNRIQAGSSLIIALVMLLIITILAIAGAKESTLEAKITGNMLEQSSLSNYAEAALREGETQLLKFNRPLEATSTCTATTGTNNYCFLDKSTSYTQEFSSASKYVNYNLGNLNGYTIKWYALKVPFQGNVNSANCDNVEYGTCLSGVGSFYYELNAEAKNTETNQKINLRSTTVKVFTH